MSEPPSRSSTPIATAIETRQILTQDKKPSYGIMPTPPSPTDVSSQSMTQSQSSSNSATNYSSTSPPDTVEPETPPRVGVARAQQRNRYTDLGRVPLHRRGTSKTYERLEDLLKEAGYKETRIFTPETERHPSKDEAGKERASVVKEGMDAVVGFFTGLLPSATASKTSLAQSNDNDAPSASSSKDYSPPPSPLTQRHNHTQQYHSLRQSSSHVVHLTEPPTPTTTTSTVTSSADSLAGETPKTSRLPGGVGPVSLSISHPHPSRQQLQKQTSRSSIYTQHHHLHHYSHHAGGASSSSNIANSNSRGAIIASPRPSRAGAYLRHMASTQSMPSRPNSTPVGLFNKPTLRLNDTSDSEDPGSSYSYLRRGNGEGEEPEEPPLPPTWLETVAKAVLFGGSGAYIGGPAGKAHSHGMSKPSTSSLRSAALIQSGGGNGKQHHVLRATRSSLSHVSSPTRRSERHRHRQSPLVRSGMSDQTNVASPTSNVFLVPPPFLGQLGRARAGKSEGEVTLTQVVCRSAPGSRSSSVVRGSSQGKELDPKDRWKQKHERGRGRNKKNKDKEQDRLPSLARTQTEGDVWTASMRMARQKSRKYLDVNDYLDDYDDDDYDDHDWDRMGGPSDGGGDSSDSDEGELDLAKILVPPKRQNSIKSLRKHLDLDSALLDAATGGLRHSHGAFKHFALAGASTAGRGMSVVVSAATPSVLKRKPTSVAEDASSQNNTWDTRGPRRPLHPSNSRERGDVTEEWGSGWVRKDMGRERASSRITLDEDDDDAESFVGLLEEGRTLGDRRSGKGALGLNSLWKAS